MPSTRRQKAKARKSREMDMRSNDNNRDMMLGGINSNSKERKFEIIINHSLGQVTPTPFLLTKFLHSKLRIETMAVELRPLGQIDA